MNNSIKNYIIKNANIPNYLTIFRAILIPVFWLAFYNSGEHKYIPLAIFLIASITDFFDGYIARKYNHITSFGKLMDPLADKLMVISVMISQHLAGVIPFTPIIIVLIKESLMILGAAYMYKKNIVVYSSLIGKIGMGLFIIALISSYFYKYFINIGIRYDMILIWISVVIAVVALVFYAITAYKKLCVNKREDK